MGMPKGAEWECKKGLFRLVEEALLYVGECPCVNEDVSCDGVWRALGCGVARAAVCRGMPLRILRIACCLSGRALGCAVARAIAGAFARRGQRPMCLRTRLT